MVNRTTYFVLRHHCRHHHDNAIATVTNSKAIWRRRLIATTTIDLGLRHHPALKWFGILLGGVKPIPVI